MATKIVPLISSSTAGPLGAVHLPRLWAKLLLAHHGALAEGYDDCGTGFDAMTLAGLNLDRQRTIEYVQRTKPTYMQFERWVIDQNGGKIDPSTVERHNTAIRGYHHAGELAASMRKSSGITDAAITDAVTLNTIDDLDQLHHQVTGA